MMRNFYCRLWLAGLIVSALQTQAMGIDMSVYGPDTVVNKQSDKLFAKGMLSPFCREGRYYWRIPDSLLDRDWLLVCRIEAAAAGNRSRNDGYAGDQVNTALYRFEKKNDKQLYLRRMVLNERADTSGVIFPAYRKSNVQGIVMAFDVRAYANEEYEIDVTDWLQSDTDLLYFSATARGVLRLGGQQRDKSEVLSVRAYDRNVEIRTQKTYALQGGLGMATYLLHTSLLLLPERAMIPRLQDERIGYFTLDYQDFDVNPYAVQRTRVINRWRLEPKPEELERYKKGELVEPAKPIVFYVDNALPAKWKKYIKLGIEDWQPAFEAIGFKNAIVARDFPTDDPDFDPDDIRYSCFRYATTTVANAMGPSWTDPRSGEIIQASVYMYHDVLKLLHNWKFVQTAQVDPKARAAVFDEETMGASLRYVASHEIGHTLGLMHNMRASYSIPVDSLRSPAFTAKYGTTTSIMDYARNNYVAQPEDKNVRLIPPLLGVYDIFMIKLGYAPIYDAETPADEYATLNKWIQEKAGDPMYTYGEQQILGTLDPASQSESLGDDAVKASRYGIKNLRYIMDHLVEWSAIENRPYDQTSELYYELTKQYQRYMGHCMAYIGGLYLNHPVAGDEQKGFVPVSREKQKEVVKFFFDEFKEQPKWMAKKEIMTLFEPNNDMVANLQANLLRNLLNSSTLGKVGMNAKYSERPYTQKEYLNDLYQGVWNKTEQGKALDYYDRNLQYAYVQYLLKELELTKDAEKSKGLSLELLTEDHLPCYCYEYHRHARQMSANTKISDLGISSKTLYYGQLVKLKELLKNRRHSASGDDKVHYDYLYFELNSALK